MKIKLWQQQYKQTTIKGRRQKIKINNAAHCFPLPYKVLVVLILIWAFRRPTPPCFWVIGLVVNCEWVPPFKKSTHISATHKTITYIRRLLATFVRVAANVYEREKEINFNFRRNAKDLLGNTEIKHCLRQFGQTEIRNLDNFLFATADLA